MTYHCLAEIRPYDPVTDARVPIRLTSSNLREITGKGGVSGGWEPALLEPPKTSMSLFEGDFRAAVKPGAARLPVNLVRARRRYSYIDRLFWPGAEVEIRVGEIDTPWPWPVHFAGRINGAGRDKEVLALACEVDAEPFEANVLNLVYAGTGGAEGGADLKDRPKPLVLGHAKNVEPVLIDAVNSVYQFSGYGAIEAVDALFERASDFGARTGDYADYDELVAATIPAGRWATSLAEGMVRLGAPAYGVITGDVRGHAIGGVTPRLTGLVIAALADIAGIPDSLIDWGSLDAIDETAPYSINVVVSEQTSLIALAQRLALPCNHQAGVSLTGKLFVASIGIGENALLRLDTRSRAEPQVIWPTRELAVSPPYAKTMLGADRCWRVHSTDEIAFDSPLIDCGAYDDEETYRSGNFVTTPDRAQWLYIHDDPGSGNAPPAWPATSNDHWANMTPPVTAGDVKFGSGQTVEDLKPNEAGADVTRFIDGPAKTTIQCDSDGNPKAGQVDPRYVQFSLMGQSGLISEGVEWDMEATSGITASIDETGRVNITAYGADGEIVVQATQGGLTKTKVHQVDHTTDPPPASGTGGTNASASINEDGVGTSLEPISGDLIVTTGSEGKVVLSATYAYWSGLSEQAYTRWYEWNGMAYVAIGSGEVASTTTPDGSLGDPYRPPYYLPGQGHNPLTVDGLGEGVTKQYRLYGRVASGTGNFSGVANAKGT